MLSHPEALARGADHSLSHHECPHRQSQVLSEQHDEKGRDLCWCAPDFIHLSPPVSPVIRVPAVSQLLNPFLYINLTFEKNKCIFKGHLSFMVNEELGSFTINNN